MVFTSIPFPQPPAIPVDETSSEDSSDSNADKPKSAKATKGGTEPKRRGLKSQFHEDILTIMEKLAEEYKLKLKGYNGRDADDADRPKWVADQFAKIYNDHKVWFDCNQPSGNNTWSKVR